MKILYAVNNIAAKSPCIVFGKIELLAEHCRNIMSLLLHGTRVPHMYLPLRRKSHSKQENNGGNCVEAAILSVGKHSFI